MVGMTLKASLPGARVGDVLVVRRRGDPLLAEIVGFDEGEVLALPLGSLEGVGPDDVVESTGGPLEVGVGPELLGRVVDGLGRPIDGRPDFEVVTRVPVDAPSPAPLMRSPIVEPLRTGIVAIDAFLTFGAGQRIGLFAGAGVGKSTLLGAIARNAAADVIVVALIGERGREVAEFVDKSLGSARPRSVMVVATSDTPALERVRAAQLATAIAEYFRDCGKHVLLLMDSITRVARAQREAGLAAGEPPARRGFPPSVFSLLPKLVERAGQSDKGTITALYTVLVEGDDLDEPVADEVRGILDGHVVMSRPLFDRGHYPAIFVPASISRVMKNVVSPAHRRAAERLRSHIALYEEKRDFILLGAYERGSDPKLDRAVTAMPELERFLRQEADVLAPFESTVAELEKLSARYGGSAV